MAFRYFVCILFSLYFLPVFCWGRVVKIGNNTDVQEQFIEDSVVYIVSSNIDLKGKTLSIPENSNPSGVVLRIENLQSVISDAALAKYCCLNAEMELQSISHI